MNLEATLALDFAVIAGATFILVSGLKGAVLHDSLRRAGPAAASYTLLVIIGLATAQFTPEDARLYPFSAWRMYTEPPLSNGTWRLRAIDRSENSRLLPLDEVIPGPGARALLWRVAELTATLFSTGPTDRTKDRKSLDAMLEAIIRIDQKRPDSKGFVGFQIERCEIGGDPPWRPESVRCRTQLTWSRSSAASNLAP